jgi:cytochrome oxidase Cu insertion factor (SCO1/SenC/PrrC family)
MKGRTIEACRRRAARGCSALLLIASALPGVADAQTRGLIQTSSPAPSGAPASFSLVGQRGQAVTDRDFRGSFMLIYFGYTYCPDLCPLGLQRISEVINVLGADAGQVVPIFITVDPERDTSKVLAAYTAYFHPRLIGLTGTREQVTAAREAFGVRGFKLFLPPSFDEEENTREDESQSHDRDNSRYLMQHSTATYLVAPDGKLKHTFPHEMSSRDMARQIQALLNN